MCMIDKHSVWWDGGGCSENRLYVSFSVCQLVVVIISTTSTLTDFNRVFCNSKNAVGSPFDLIRQHLNG